MRAAYKRGAALTNQGQTAAVQYRTRPTPPGPWAVPSRAADIRRERLESTFPQSMRISPDWRKHRNYLPVRKSLKGRRAPIEPIPLSSRQARPASRGKDRPQKRGDANGQESNVKRCNPCKSKNPNSGSDQTSPNSLQFGEEWRLPFTQIIESVEKLLLPPESAAIQQFEISAPKTWAVFHRCPPGKWR